MKKILIIGASGFIGSSLQKGLNDCEIFTLKGRSVLNTDLLELSELLSGYSTIINLAGRSILWRWTKKSKREMYESRIHTTRKIGEALKISNSPPAHFINASAIGIYKPEIHADEFTMERNDDFLANLVYDWEKEAEKIKSNTTKLALIRIGIVLGKSFGAYKILRILSSFNLGSVFNGGKQSLSFIGIHDLVRAIDYIIQNELTGVINLVNPEFSDYKSLNDILKKYSRALITWNLPGIFIKIALGESSSMFLKGHKIKPSVLLKNNFIFETPNLETCVDKIEGN